MYSGGNGFGVALAGTDCCLCVRAGCKEARMTGAGTPRRLWIAITVAAIALSACTGVGSSAAESTDSGSQGSVVLFCRAWPDARETILGAVSGATSFDLRGDPTVGLDRNFVDS